jgi:ferredoxin
MRVWIDQAECIGVGTCVDVCPQVFALDSDGIAVVEFGGRRYGDNEQAEVNSDHLERVLDAAEDCPQSCIYVEA